MGDDQLLGNLWKFQKDTWQFYTLSLLLCLFFFKKLCLIFHIIFDYFDLNKGGFSTFLNLEKGKSQKNSMPATKPSHKIQAEWWYVTPLQTCPLLHTGSNPT